MPISWEEAAQVPNFESRMSTKALNPAPRNVRARHKHKSMPDYVISRKSNRKSKPLQKIIENDLGYMQSLPSSDPDSPGFSNMYMNQLDPICEIENVEPQSMSFVFNTESNDVELKVVDKDDALTIYNSDFETDFETVIVPKPPLNHSPPRPLVDFSGAYDCDSSAEEPLPPSPLRVKTQYADEDSLSQLPLSSRNGTDNLVEIASKIELSQGIGRAGKRRRSSLKSSPTVIKLKTVRRKGSGRAEKKRKVC